VTAYSIPSLTTIGVLFGGAIAAFGAAAWLIAQGAEDYEINSFPLILVGMIALFIALALFALRVINRRHGTTPPGA
jgi:tellurite resistance protein TehA-like permease